MKYLISFIFMLILANVYGQYNDPDFEVDGREHQTSDHAGINLVFGYYHPLIKSNLHRYFEQTYQSDFGQLALIGGLSYSGPLEMGSAANYDNVKHFDGNIGFQYHTTSTYKPNDTTSFRLGGYHINYALGHDLLFFWKKVDFNYRIGFDAGLMQLKMNKKSYRNPFFDVTLQLEPRVIIWRFVLSAKAEMGFDITSKKWKPKNNTVNDVLSYRNHFASYVVGLGFILF